MRTSTFSSSSSCALFVACCVLFTATPASAQKNAAPLALSQSLTGGAKSAYESARLVFDDGDYAGALTKFKSAYDASKDSRLLWNMAVCEKELRHYARAATLVTRYLKEGANLLSAEQQRSANDTHTALRAFYSTVTFSGIPDGASIFVDGIAFGRTPLSEPTLLDLGTRKLRVEMPGYAPFETDVEVPGTTVLDVPVVLALETVTGATAPHLSVTSSGERDIVSVDAKVVGSRHWEGALTVGEHTVRVTALHKKPYEIHLQLLAGSVRSLEVTLEDETRSALWYWVAGGATLAAGAVVGGYFLLKPKDEPGSHANGSLTTIFLPSGSMGAGR